MPSSRAAVLAALLLAVAALDARAQIRFERGSLRRCTREPLELVVADFNGDRRPDLAIADAENGEVDVFLGGPGGSLGDGPSSPSRGHLEAGDFDGDGRVDLFAAARTRGAIEFLRGNGDGTFTAARHVPGTADSLDTDGADFDRDGFVDALVTRPDGLTFVRGGFGGGAPVASDVPLQVTAAFATVTGDFDEDGSLDAVVLSGTDDVGYELVWVRGDGRGAFFPALRGAFAPGTCLTRIQAVNASPDGHLDLLVAGWNAFLLAGNGAGGFGAPIEMLQNVVAEDTIGGDFDADGRFDLVTSLDYTTVVVLRGDGTGGFAEPAPIGGLPSGPIRAESADFDRDGHADVMVGMYPPERGAPGLVKIFLNRSANLCQTGTVNSGVGAPVDVVLVNGSAGGTSRTVTLSPVDAISIVVAAPPAVLGLAPFALYAWGGFAPDERHPQPFGIGATCFPTPLDGGAPLPLGVWNNTGRAALGEPTRPSSPAPSVVLNRPSGLGRTARFFLQGIIVDPGSAGSVRASVTNGVSVVVR